MKIVIPLPEGAEVLNGELVIHYTKVPKFKKWLVDTLTDLKWAGAGQEFVPSFKEVES